MEDRRTQSQAVLQLLTSPPQGQSSRPLWLVAAQALLRFSPSQTMGREGLGCPGLLKVQGLFSAGRRSSKLDGVSLGSCSFLGIPARRGPQVPLLPCVSQTLDLIEME